MWFPVPPTGYGGIEWVVSVLADGLVDAGHDVTLFASGDSRTKATLVAVYAEARPDEIGSGWIDVRHSLACYERWPEAQRIARRMIEAARHFGNQLPEVFAGFPRTETPFPIAYPTAARPQAWAAGAPVLLLQILLGLQPNRRRHVLDTVAPPELPSWVGSITLTGVRAFERSWNVVLDGGNVRVDEA